MKCLRSKKRLKSPVTTTRVLLAASAVRSLMLTCCKLESSPVMVVGVRSGWFRGTLIAQLGKRSVKLRIITPPCEEPACTVATIACGAGKQMTQCHGPGKGLAGALVTFKKTLNTPTLSAVKIEFF